MHQRKRFISFLLVVSILLSTLYLPAGATQTVAPNETSSAVSTVSEDVLAAAELAAGIPVDFENEAILQYVDQDVFRASNHIKRLPQEETLDTYVYLNQDGTKSVYFMEENVKYVDFDGKVQNKDISLQETKNGFTTVQNDVSVFIPTNAENGIQVSHTIGNLKLIPESSLIVVAGKQDGNSVLYANYFGKGMSLRYTPLLSGVKEDIILASYTGKNSFQFALDTNGLFVYEDAEDGYYVAASQATEDRYYLGEIIVYDALGRPSMGTMTVKTVTAGARYILTVTADPAFLTDADTVYPVTIDPSITISSQNDSSLIWDSPIFSGYPTWTCGAYQYLTLGNAGENYGIGQAVIKLPGLYQSSTYTSISASQITSVRFYCRDGSGNPSQYINLYANTGNSTWTDGNVSWNNIGSYSTVTNWGNYVPDFALMYFDITTLVKGWKNGIYNAGAGFRLVHTDNVTRSNHKTLFGSEYATASYRPYVVMTYSDFVAIHESRVVMIVDESIFLQATSTLGALTWTSSDPLVATVSSNGYVTAHKEGKTTITAASVMASGAVYTDTCIVHVCPVHEGVYVLENKQTGMFVDINGQVMSDGTTIHQWQYHGGNTQKWIFTYLDDGYYSIKSAKTTSPYYLGVIGDSAALNVDIILRFGSLYDGMKWKISATESGGYKLIPKTGENNGYVLATSTSEATNGAKLIQGAYVYNNSYRDEWMLGTVKDYMLMYIGAYVGDPEMPYIKTVVDNVLRINCGMDGSAYTDINKSEAIFELTTSRIFSCITHGTRTGIATSNGYITVNDINNLDDTALEYLRFACIGACLTGKDEGNGDNFVNALYAKGANAVLGFTEEILIDETNFWIRQFMGYLANWNTIDEAMSAADEALDNDETLGDKDTYTVSNRYIVGNVNDIPCS